MTTMESTLKRLALLAKPLHLFIEEDVNAGVVLRYQAMEEWKRCGLYYVAELLCERCDVSFMPVYRLFKGQNLSENALNRIETLLPVIEGEDLDACYKTKAAEIESVLLLHQHLWANQLEEPEIKDSGRIFNIHIKERDLDKAGIDFDLMESLFLDEHFHSAFSALVKEHAKKFHLENTETPA